LPLDKFGIPFIYPTKKTAGLSGTGSGFFWQQSNNIHDDDDYEGDAMLRLGKEHDDVQVIDEDTGEWEFPYLTDGDGLDMSGPTGHHTGGVTHGCQGFTYMCDTNLMGANPSFRFRKETYHVQYNDHPDGEFTHPSATGPAINNWKGMCWVSYNKKDGRSPGKDSRICEVWWNNNPTADLTNWVMLKRVEDKGAGVTNWGVPATCDGDDYQVGTWSNIQFRFKSSSSDFSLHPLIPEPDGTKVMSIGVEDMSFSDCEARGYGKRIDMPRDIEMKCLVKWDAGGRGKAHFKNISIREIDPTISFDDTPNEPPDTGGGTGGQPGETTEVQGSFKFQWDINTLRSSPCAGAGTGGGSGTGNAIFYTVTSTDNRELSNSVTYDNRTRIVEKVVNSSSILKGKTPKQLDVLLKKEGTPTTPLIHAKIWNSAGTVVYDSPTTVDPSTLTSSLVKTTFDFSTNTHALVTGDYIGIEWTGTSDVDFVDVGVAYSSSYDSTNSIESQYEGGTWDDKTTRDCAFDIWE